MQLLSDEDGHLATPWLGGRTATYLEVGRFAIGYLDLLVRQWSVLESLGNRLITGRQQLIREQEREKMLSSMNTEAYTKLVERASAEGGTSVKLDSYERTASSMVPYSNELLINGKLQCVTRMMETLDKAVCAPEVLLQALKWLETCALNLYANPSRQEIATIAVSFGRLLDMAVRLMWPANDFVEAQ